MCMRGPNKMGFVFGICLFGSKVRPVPNFVQKPPIATTFHSVCKRTQHVKSINVRLHRAELVRTEGVPSKRVVLDKHF